MRISITATLAVCFIATLASPASARRRHHHMMHLNVAMQDSPTPSQNSYGYETHVTGVQPSIAMGAPFAPSFGAGPAPSVQRERIGRRHFPVVASNAYAMAGPMTSGAMTGGAAGMGDTSLVSEARRWMGGNPTGRSSLWCGNFMNFVLERTGHPESPSNTAKSFASYGHRLSGPQVGAIAVMSRGRNGGHVGVVSGIDESGNPIIISGNHGHRVGEGVYPRGRIFAYVAP